MRALLSVSDKTGLIDFARRLASLGCELVSTGGTAKALAAAGLPVVSVSDVTGFPEMLDGRVKTLHPKIHGGILARRGRADDMRALHDHQITPVDIVVVNLYPFEETAARPEAGFDEIIENIDIGGPSLLRAAAKNFQDVLVVVDPSDYAAVIDAIGSDGGASTDFRFRLARKAFTHTGHYDTAISKTLAEFVEGSAGERRPAPAEVRLRLRKARDLRYGENPHQRAALYNAHLDVLQGKELSFTNLLDLDAAQRIVREFTEPAAAVLKHANPCGAATGSAIADAYVAAREADSLSAFGGIVGLNRTLDVPVAEAIVATFIEAVVAPSVDETALDVLRKKPNLRVVVPATRETSTIEHPFHGVHQEAEFRSIAGGVLMQTADRVTEAAEPWPRADFPKVVTKRQPTPEEWQALRFAWRVCAHVKSNAVIFTDATRTLAIGAGQMSRVDAVNVAVMKATADSLKGSVAASDAFFPFRDGLDAVAVAGATAVVQPGGSVRDAEVIAAADERGLAMVFTGIRHFRH
jgi:phosphoribosylaminoimidazolecarboxamide formyltransferase/IMP cyclohydrolase